MNKHAVLGFAAAVVLAAGSYLFADDKNDLTPESTVTGRVTDTDGNPIAGAKLFIRDWESGEHHSWTGRSDRKGQFSLDAKPGKSRLFVSASGYASQFRTHDVSKGANPGWDFVLPCSGRVSGRIVDTNGKPARGRALELGLVGGSVKAGPDVWTMASEGENKTGEDGEFDLPNVAPGKHSIVVYSPSPFGGDRNMEQTPVNARYLEVESEEHLKDVKLVVNPPENFFLAGHVRDENGKPLPGVGVDTFIPHGRHWWTKTDAQGAFRIEGLDGMGMTKFSVDFDGFPGIASWKPKLRDVPLNSGNIEVIVPGKASIEGNVRNAKTGQPVAAYELKVHLVECGSQGLYWQEPNAKIERQPDGSFVIGDVPAANATIEVRAEGLGVQRFTVPLQSGTTATLACEMKGPAILEGRTTMNGKPKGVGVVVDDQWLNTDDGGNFRFDKFANGKHTIWFFERDGWHRTAEVELKSGETTRLDMEMAGTGEVKGSVRFPDEEAFCSIRLASKLAPDGWFEFGRPSPEEYVLTYSSLKPPGGEFQMRGVPPGKYYLMAGSYRPQMHRSLLAASREIEIKEGETVSFDFDLTTSASANTIRSDRPRKSKSSPGMHDAAKKPAKRVPPDKLVGWYEIAGSETIIPVLKNGRKYFTVGPRGMEIPLKETTVGLELDLEPSSLAGTTIGFDDASQQVYIALFDSMAASMNENFESGKKHRLTRIMKPEGIPDPTTRAPRSIDDFVGWYQPVWMPMVRWEITKQGDAYHLRGQSFREGEWKDDNGTSESLTVLPDKTGLSSDHEKVRLVYSKESRRYEVLMGNRGPVMPLVRIKQPPARDTRKPPALDARIGIPAWN